MALTLAATYNDDLGRIQITISGASADADYAKVEYSTDQITWTTIRGGDTVALSGGAGHVDHYDGYQFETTNYYRVSAIDSADPSVFGTGSFVTANNASVVPGLPAGTIPTGAKLLLFATHANPAASITTPTGWTRLSGGGTNAAMFYRDYAAGVTAPTVAFAGGTAGDSCSAQIRAFLNVQDPVHLAFQSNASAQNVAFPTATVPAGLNGLGILHLWKASVFTGVTGLPTQFVGAGAGGGNNTAGSNDESQLHYYTTVNPGTITAGSATYTGGVADVSKARIAYVAKRLFTDQAITSINPVLPNKNIKPYWLMNPGRPGQNRRIEITELSEITNDGRTQSIEILGRSWPVVLSDFMASDVFTISIDAVNKAECNEIVGRLALGEPMYLLTPDVSNDIDSVYFTATRMSRAYDAKMSSWTITVECREITQPAPAVYGQTYVWADVVSDYATWADVVAAVPTWSNLVDKVSTDVIIVP